MTRSSLILASASPRRKKLLEQIGLQFSISREDINESRLANESPEKYVRRMAEEKASSALSRPQSFATIVIAADTLVVKGSWLMGKPVDREDCLRMLNLLSDGDHRVLSAVCVATAARRKIVLHESIVSFGPISEQQAENYWFSGEPKGKAGSYGIQGLGGLFVRGIAGSYSSVMGLPLFETANLLKEFGVDCLAQVNVAENSTSCTSAEELN